MTNRPNEQESRAKEFLGRVGRITRRVKWKKSQVESLEELATGCSAQISDMPRSPSPNLQRVETLVCKIADLKESIKADEATLDDAKIELALMICRIPNETQQQVLTERYLNLYGWQDVIENVGYSRTHVFRAHEDGLCMVESLLAADEYGRDYDGTKMGLDGTTMGL